MRSSAWDTPARSCARSVLCWPAFPLVPALRSTGSAAAGAALFAGFIATISGSDFSCPCIIGYGSSPSRRGPDNPRAARSDTRSPRFRPAPFVRDGVLDHDGVSTPCMAAPHILPSALGTASASVTSELSLLNIPPHTIAVYASWLPSPAGHATLATGRVLALTRAGLSPAGPDQLILTHPQAAGHAQHTRRCAPLRGGLRPSLTAAARDALGIVRPGRRNRACQPNRETSGGGQHRLAKQEVVVTTHDKQRGGLFSRRSDPIEVTRPHRGPGSVFAATRGIFGVDAIGPDVPVRVPPPRAAAFWLGREDERPVRRRTAHVNCHDPVRVRPKLPPLFPFAVPTGNADTLYLAVSAGQHFLDRAAAGGAPDRVMLGRW